MRSPQRRSMLFKMVNGITVKIFYFMVPDLKVHRQKNESAKRYILHISKVIISGLIISGRDRQNPGARPLSGQALTERKAIALPLNSIGVTLGCI